MKFGFSLIVRGNEATPDTFARIAERAVGLEIDSLWCSAHVIVPPQVKSGYILIPGRKHPEHWKECYWEPFTVLSFLAGLTSKITLGASHLVFDFVPESLATALDTMERFAQEVRPELSHG